MNEYKMHATTANGETVCDIVKADNTEEAVHLLQERNPMLNKEEVVAGMEAALDNDDTAVPVPPQVRWGISIFELEDGSMAVHPTGNPSFNTIMGLLHKGLENTRANLIFETFIHNRRKNA